MNLKIDSGVTRIDLSHLVQYVEWEQEHHCFFPMYAGENHHLLLAYLSSQLPKGSKVIDLGTCYGASALALSYNKDVQVVTYDVMDLAPSYLKTYHSVSNIKFIKDDCFNHIDTYLEAKIILLDISPHNGGDERRMLDELVKRDYKGLLILDDILYNKEMKDFFNSVTQEKYDLTPWGHFSGTGLVVFEKETLGVEF